MDLKQSVKDKITSLGPREAASFFGVSLPTVYNWLNGKTCPSIDAALKVDPNPGASSVKDEITMWEGKSVHVMLPVYKTFNPKTHYTLFANYARYGPEKIGMTVEWGTQIHVARNLLAHKALKTDAKWFYTVDDDMGLPCGSAALINGRFGGAIPEPGASMVAFSRMASHPDDMRIVGALYFGRHRFGPAQCSMGFDQGWEVNNPKLREHRVYTSPIAMRWVAPGFMRIHRSVFEELKAAIDEGKFPECAPKGPDRPYGFFTPIHTDAGEDVSFGLRCAEIGIQSWLDPVLECLHFGDIAYGNHNTENKRTF